MTPADRGPSLEGRTFRDVTEHPAGDVGDGTVFTYHEDSGGTIWAQYVGGSIRVGYLVGTRVGDELDFRYVHVTITGETASGHCASRLETLPDGRVRLQESWQWESRPGAGTSVLEELGP